MYKLRLLLGLVLVTGIVSANLSAQITFFNWSSITSGSALGITATVSNTITTGQINTAGTRTPTDVTFLSTYGDSYEALEFANIGGVANITSTFSFSSTLPSGSLLVVFDVDTNAETFTLLGGGGMTPLSLLNQLESKLGQTSAFPVYTPGTGVLNSGGDNNSDEASVFDVSGFDQLTISFTVAGNSGSELAIAAVPEPSAFAAFGGLFALAFAGFRRRKNRACVVNH